MRILANHVKCCPALPRLGARIYRGTPERMLPQAMELLEKEQMLTITGTNQDDFDLNRLVGKTYLARNIAKEIEASGQKVSINNLQQCWTIRHTKDQTYADADEINLMIAELGRDDVYIFDEAQWGFVTEPLSGKALFNVLMYNYWEKLGRLLDEGKRLVFVTPSHPFDRFNKSHYYDPTSALYFTAPIIEVMPSSS